MVEESFAFALRRLGEEGGLVIEKLYDINTPEYEIQYRHIKELNLCRSLKGFTISNDIRSIVDMLMAVVVERLAEDTTYKHLYWSIQTYTYPRTLKNEEENTYGSKRIVPYRSPNAHTMDVFKNPCFNVACWCHNGVLPRIGSIWIDAEEMINDPVDEDAIKFVITTDANHHILFRSFRSNLDGKWLNVPIYDSRDPVNMDEVVDFKKWFVPYEHKETM